jgi:hypothetical protein
MSPYPLLLVVLGVVVLLLGRRLAVLGAAVGAILGVAFLHLFSVQADPLFTFGVVIGLAVAGFFLAGAAKGIVNIVLVVLCALAGAAIVIGFIDLFNFSIGRGMELLFAAVGALAGWMVYRRFNDGAMIILSAIIGALLIMRGLTTWLPSLDGALGTLLAIVIAGAGIGVQSGYFAKRKAAAQEQAAAQAQVAAPAPAAAPAQAPAMAAAPAAQSGDQGASTNSTTSG